MAGPSPAGARSQIRLTGCTDIGWPKRPYLSSHLSPRRVRFRRRNQL